MEEKAQDNVIVSAGEKDSAHPGVQAPVQAGKARKTDSPPEASRRRQPCCLSPWFSSGDTCLEILTSRTAME